MVKLNQPYFSIIIPTFNRAHLISSSIKSIQNQSFQNWECIIVDDGSTDDTKNVVMEFISSDTRFKYLFQENQERSVARNNGVLNSRGDYICFLDSDDYYLPNRLENLFRYIKKENSKFVFTDIIFKNGLKKKHIKYDIPNENIYDFLATNVIGIPQVCIKREIIKKNLFNPSIYIGEDLELWIRIAKNHSFSYQKNNCSVVAVEHIDRSVNLLSSNSPKEQLKTFRIIFQKNHPGNNISKKIKKLKLSNCYFNSARHYMYNNKKFLSAMLLLRSLICNFKDEKTKHKILCLLNLITFKIPQDYKSNDFERKIKL